MSVIATVNRQISITSSPNTVSGSVNGFSQSVGNTTFPISQSYPAASVNTVLAVTFAFATLQQIFLLSDKGMTIKFNSSSSPVPTLVLQPGSPFEWNASDGYFANIFTANVTTAFVSCTPASRLTGWILTP